MSFAVSYKYFSARKSDPYPNNQPEASNLPANYIAESNRWLPLGAYGSVELGKADAGLYIRTRHTYYKVPDDIEKSDRVAIAQWVIKAIEHSGISIKALYPVILSNSDSSINLNPNYNVPRYVVSNRPQVPQIGATNVLNRVQHDRKAQPGSVNFKPLSPPECWLGTDHGQVILGTSTDFPGRYFIKTKGEAYYGVPANESQSRTSIRAWIERAIQNKAITTTLYPNPALANKPESLPEIGKDMRIIYQPMQEIVDEEYGNTRITRPVAPKKQFTDDLTVRIQPWRGDAFFLRPFRPKEELFECKIISTLGRPGCDIKSKWILPTEKIPVLDTILKKIHGKIEFESSGAVRYVNREVVGQGAISIKLNISNPKPGPD